MAKSLIYKKYKGKLDEAYRNKVVMINRAGDIEYVHRYSQLPASHPESKRYVVRCTGVTAINVVYSGTALDEEYGNLEGRFFYQYGGLNWLGRCVANKTADECREYLYD